MTELLTNQSAQNQLFSLDAEAIERLPWIAFDGVQGVRYKILWRLGSYVQSLIRYDAGAATSGDPHFSAHHHIWVLAGTMTLAGRRLGPGSYVYVPAGVPHPVDGVGAEGCTFLQMYRPHASAEVSALV